MTLPAATKNAMLDSLTYTHVSLHTAWPGTTGANEVTGGGYARQAITVGAAAGGIRTLSGAASFSVPATTVTYFGFWNGATFLKPVPNGGFTPRNFMSLASSDTVYSAAHGYVDTDTIAFYQGTPPAPLVEGTVYYVRDSTADSFKIAATSGGAAIDLTAAPSFGCLVCKITPQAYVAPGTHVLSSFQDVVPD